jgi:hypothetical protein
MREIFGDNVCVVSDDDAATFPSNPIEIGDGSLHVQSGPVRPDCLADGSAPAVDAGESQWEETGLGSRTVYGKTSQTVRLARSMAASLRSNGGFCCRRSGYSNHHRGGMASRFARGVLWALLRFAIRAEMGLTW